MIGRRKFVALAACGVGLTLLNGCGAQNPYKLYARVIVYIDTPAGTTSGSSVYEIWANWSLPGSKRRIWGERGQAIAVDLPNGQTLFSLLQTKAIHGDMASMVLATYDDDFNNTMVESTAEFSGWGKGYGDSEPKAVAPQNYPMFVTFTDINDPRSVKQIDPSNLTDTFGKGYVLKTITVHLTDRPVTKGIEKRLPWLSKHRNKSFAGNRYSESNTLVDSLYMGSFTTEL